MKEIIRTITWPSQNLENADFLLTKEWLVTNGLGGYASGTISGINTRRYHGLLIAALPSPYGRVVMLNQLNETVIFPDGSRVRLNGEERTSCALQMYGNCYLAEFSLKKGLPVWLYQISGISLEKRVFMRHQQNTVQISYRVLSGETSITLELQPNVHFRPHHEPVDTALHAPYILTIAPESYELSSEPNHPVLRMLFHGPEVSFTVEGSRIEEFIYREESNQGYPGKGALWDPGNFRMNLEPGQEVIFIASTHSLATIQAMTPEEAVKAENDRRELLLGVAHPALVKDAGGELVIAADQFIITPAGRREDTARIRASGGDVRTVIAGYHWFTDWGRDTMISLEGLTLLTGRYLEARWILYTFAHYIHNGLIPNMFPEGKLAGIFNTADATLWFFHAMDRYLEYTRDRTTLRLILPRLKDIINFHIKGTDFNIAMDEEDGLIRQGQEGYALTWMDAKVGDWVVTPRRGKAVEINALWYNALRLLERWISEEESESAAQYLTSLARKVRRSFNQKFWYASGGYLYDIVDGEQGNDYSLRPNQILAISLRFPVLERSRWQAVIDIIKEKLLTPAGLRTLAPEHSGYKSRYYGDIRARDAAYHQGTVWAWLIGPFIDAWLKINPDKKTEARNFLDGLISSMDKACIGTISEIFDADPPFTPRGCIAQAWSVAETLRCWVKTASG
jgi:predicted glycogen debranching enzyme